MNPDKSDISLDDVLSWADGILGALGTEYANRVTKEEAAAATVLARIFKLPSQSWMRDPERVVGA